MNRKTFLQASIAFAAANSLSPSCKNQRTVKGGIIGPSAAIGHLLRDKKFDDPVTQSSTDVVIIGGGVSGLSAARLLHQQGLDRFVLLDLEKSVGGNAVSGSNNISSFPWGAHYVPIANLSLTEYIDFLTEAGVITGFSEENLPVYNDYFLCFDPQDRLYINGRWQQGIIPHDGLPEADLKQIETFLHRMETFRSAKGGDGRDAFALPINDSSKDPAFVKLDSITMETWLNQEGFTSSFLHWFVNYSTRDDFGTRSSEVSAWAGIHYFACRKGRAANAGSTDLLTWPEGNAWLVQRLKRNYEEKILTSCLGVHVKSLGDGVIIDYFDLRDNTLRRINARQCILAVPQFVSCRLLNDVARGEIVRDHFHYTPWMVANLTVGILEERNGAPMSWDNVIFDSPSLGYVEATHELLGNTAAKKNLTYYYPMTAFSAEQERQNARSRTYKEWVDIIMTDLQKIHPNIREATEEINVMVWGHAMAQPRPGLIHGPVRDMLRKSLANKIHFAHTDLAGISIFEEAFYQGLHAARQVIANLTQ